MKHWTTDGRIQSDTRHPRWALWILTWDRAPRWLCRLAARSVK